MKLAQQFTVWLQLPAEHYQQANHIEICQFGTVQAFWSYYQFLKRPTQLVPGQNFYFFKKGIKPVWEDPANTGGGSFAMKFRLNYSDSIWQQLVLKFIIGSHPHYYCINGLRLRRQKDLITIQVWVGKDVQKCSGSLEQWIQSAVKLQKSDRLYFAPFRKT